jgi:hypothetical protein
MMTLTEHLATCSRPDPFEHPSPLNNREFRRECLGLVGFEEQIQKTAPLDDPEWDIAGLNMGNRLGIHADSQGRFRADYWFDLHQRHTQDQKDMAWIEACPVPIYLPADFGPTTNPLQRSFDVKQVMTLSANAEPYFASSFAYIVAWAIAKGYTTIGLFGVSLDWGRERIVERGNLEYWLGYAAGMGVRVITSANSKLFTHPGLYGLEYDKERDGVIDVCATVVRQLLQTPDTAGRIHEELQGRADELKRLGREIRQSVEQLIYQKRQA